MARPEQIPINRHLTVEELNRRIKFLEKDVKVLQRLYFVKNRYAGESVEESANRVSITKQVAYIWQERWNKEGYDGLKPKFAGGTPSKLSDEQKEQLKEMLTKRDDWTTEEVRTLVFRKFNVEYTLKQIRVILKNFGMKLAKPYPHDYRKPVNAEELLKKPSRN